MFKNHLKARGAGKENIAPPWHKRFSDAITASSVYSNHSNGTVVRPLFSTFSEMSPPSSPDQLNGPEAGSWDAAEDVSPVEAVGGQVLDNSNQNEKRYATPSVLAARDPNSRGNGFSQQTPAPSYGGKPASKGNMGLKIITEPREPWKGASGRSAVLPALVDKPLPKQKRPIVPRRSSKRPTSLLLERQLEVRPLSIVHRSPVTAKVSGGIDCCSSDEDEEIKPIPPLKVSRHSVQRSATPSSRKSMETTTHPTTSPAQDLTTGTRQSSMGDAKTYLPISVYRDGDPSTRGGSVDSIEQLVAVVQTDDTWRRQQQQQEQEEHDQQEQQPVSRFSWTTAATSTACPHRESADAVELLREAVQLHNIDERHQQQMQQPVSRFSWTTAAVSAAHQSPPDTPVLTSEGAPPTPRPASPILDRTRPIPSPSYSPAPNYAATTSRKPTPSQLTVESSLSPSDSISQYDRRSSTICTKSKALPLSPPELESVDLVTSLQAQLDDLRLRRANLEKLVNRSTQLQPQNPVVQDLAKRKQAKEQAKALEWDIEGLRREEYEVGLRMHRAWRRREGGTEGPSVLWVRRVTA